MVKVNDASTIDTYSVYELLSLIGAALCGKVSGADSNAPVFRSADDSANRISATTTADDNRTAVTLTPAS